MSHQFESYFFIDDSMTAHFGWIPHNFSCHSCHYFSFVINSYFLCNSFKNFPIASALFKISSFVFSCSFKYLCITEKYSSNIFTIIKCSLSAFNNSLNNKYLVDSYYLILFVAFAFTTSLGICEEQA